MKQYSTVTTVKWTYGGWLTSLAILLYTKIRYPLHIDNGQGSFKWKPNVLTTMLLYRRVRCEIKINTQFKKDIS